MKVFLRRIVIVTIFVFTVFSRVSANDIKNGAVIRALDNFHLYASKADEAGYIGSMAEGGIFLGTDPDELWTRDQFRKFVHKYFSKGIGWTYIPSNRRISFSRDGKIAWFSEDLENKKYGKLRGTGVLRKEKGGWKIVQYNMVFTIPNDCTSDVVSIIKKYRKNRED